jgi:uncharacterized protein YkuJ
VKKILLIILLLFISCIYAQPQSFSSKGNFQNQQGLSNLRLDRSIVVYGENPKEDKVESTFDDNGKLTLYIAYSWENFTKTSFVPIKKKEYTYDANGNRTLYIYYYWNTTTQSFVPSNKFEYTYDANGNQVLSISYGWSTTTQSFVPNYKSEYTVDANGNQVLSISYGWSSTTQSFVPESKSEYTVDANGNQTLNIYYYWSTTTQSFVLNGKLEYTYDANGNQVLSISYVWSSTTQSFVPSYKIEYTYDANGNQTFSIGYYYSTTTTNTTPSFVPNGKGEYNFDTNGNQTLSIRYSWNTITQSFVPNDKIVSSYNNGLIASKMIYYWYGDLGVFKPSFKTEYAIILDTATQLNRMGVSYMYDTNFNVWNLIGGEESKSYYYYTKTGELSTQMSENGLLLLYPNPTSELLYISNPKLSSLDVRIVDLNGKQMYSRTIQKDVPLDVSSYTQGMYLVTIENKETKKKNTYKIIKK